VDSTSRDFDAFNATIQGETAGGTVMPPHGTITPGRCRSTCSNEINLVATLATSRASSERDTDTSTSTDPSSAGK